MYNENIGKLSCMVLVIGTLLGLTGCSAISSKPIQKEEIIAPDVDDIATEHDIEGQEQDTKRGFGTEGQNDGMELQDREEESIGLDEAEIVNAARFGNSKEVLDNSVFTSDVEVKKTGEDESEIEFELEYVGLCTFAASKGEEFVLPNEVFVDSGKIEWTAPMRTVRAGV